MLLSFRQRNVGGFGNVLFTGCAAWFLFEHHLQIKIKSSGIAHTPAERRLFESVCPPQPIESVFAVHRPSIGLSGHCNYFLEVRSCEISSCIFPFF
jgi:hypothetical protein